MLRTVARLGLAVSKAAKPSIAPVSLVGVRHAHSQLPTTNKELNRMMRENPGDLNEMLSGMSEEEIEQYERKYNLDMPQVELDDHGHPKLPRNKEELEQLLKVDPLPRVREANNEFFQIKFSNPFIDDWQMRRTIHQMMDQDMIPEPETVEAGLRACRRLNDYALAIRFLEAIQLKCGNEVKVIWPWMEQQLRPVLDELGILTPAEMGYDKPELACPDVSDIH